MMLISGGGRVLRSFMAPTSTVMIANRQSSVLAAIVSPLLSAEAYATKRTPLAIATTPQEYDRYYSSGNNFRFTSSLLTPAATNVPLSSPSLLWRNTKPFFQAGNSLGLLSSLPYFSKRSYGSLVSNRIAAIMTPFQNHQQPQPTKKDITIRFMNRNARKAKRANHGKRPCSRIRRRYKTKKWANTCRKG